MAVPDKLRRELLSVVGERRLSARDSDRATYARDMWPRLLLAIRAGTPVGPRPDLVVWPEDEREVLAIVKIARAHGAPIVPYGGGSGVCGGVVPLRGGVTIDMKRMTQLVAVDRDALVCDVEAGSNGERFERELARRGFTFGHFPSSIYCSTVGGWLACRAAGQMSTKYGKVEDRVVGLTAVTGRGELVRTDGMSRAQRGPAWNHLLLGSEGTLAVITSARLRLSPAPELRLLRGFEFADVDRGTAAIRRVLQAGLRPAVVRLYDEVDTFINHLAIFKSSQAAPAVDPLAHAPRADGGEGALPSLPRQEQAGAPGALARTLGLFGRSAARVKQELKRDAMAQVLGRPRLVNAMLGRMATGVSRHGCRLILGLEGSRIRTEVEARLAIDEMLRAGGKDLGEEPGRDWLAHRYAVSYKMSPTFRDGAFVDTMEVAATWDRLGDLYRSVKAAIARHALVMAHFSHAYSEGCSIYFTFVAHDDDHAASCARYDAIWRDGMAATSRAGGTISHHHGVGLLKAPFMATEHREAMAILRAAKLAFDPDGIMNPGKLGLEAAP